MSWWVFRGKRQRVMYLSLMRRSPASTRFARTSLIVLALSASVFALSHFGWRVVKVDPAVPGANSTEPEGRGWLRVVAGMEQRALRPGRLTPVAVWWNLPQAAIAVPSAFVLTLLAGGLVLSVVSHGVEHSLTPPFRGEERYQAAIRYSSGAVSWFLFASLVSLALIPAHVADVRDWSFAPAPSGVHLASAILGSFGLLVWWFWLIRAAGTAPPPTRTRVVTYFSVWVPLLVVTVVAAVVAILVFGLGALAPLLFVHW